MNRRKNQKIIIEDYIKKFETENLSSKEKQPSRGINYTPKKLVEFMVNNVFQLFLKETLKLSDNFTVEMDFHGIISSLKQDSKLHEDFKAKIKGIKILDPACGTGRFLVSIADKLYKFHILFEEESTDIEIRKEIVQNNIYGVEIETTACKITELRLINWIYSGTFENEGLYIDEDNIEDLREIERFILESKVQTRVKNTEFLLNYEIDDFDMIIGNPPYVENKKITHSDYKQKLKNRFESAYKLFDLSVLFLEKSISLLKPNTGILSFLTTNKFLSADYGIKIRSFILEKTEIKGLINISSIPIFQNTAAYPIIITLQKKTQVKDHRFQLSIYGNLEDLYKYKNVEFMDISQDTICKIPSKVIPVSAKLELIENLYNKHDPLSKAINDVKIIYRPFGFLNWDRNFEYINPKRTSNNDLILIGTGNVDRYHVNIEKRIRIAKRNVEVSFFSYQQQFEKVWRDLKGEKLIFREIARKITCAYDPGIFTNITGLYFIKVPSFNSDQLFAVLAILNSRLMNFVFNSLYGSLHMSGGYLRYNGSFIKRLPFPRTLPSQVSALGKILQFLTDTREIQGSNYKNILNYDVNRSTIDKMLMFFEDVTNALVNEILYGEFEDIRVLAKLESLNSLPSIIYKLIPQAFNLPEQVVYSIDEHATALKAIIQSHDHLKKNQSLLSRVTRANKIL